MREELLRPTSEGEARILLLIDAFTTATRALEGRTKLAKLDFLLRYPDYLRRALAKREAPEASMVPQVVGSDIESGMVRYRYGPWDPSYFAILGSLLGRGLVQAVPDRRGLAFRATDSGQQVAASLREEPSWDSIADRIRLLRRYFDLSGETLKRLIYENFPEVTSADWGKPL